MIMKPSKECEALDILWSVTVLLRMFPHHCYQVGPLPWDWRCASSLPAGGAASLGRSR